MTYTNFLGLLLKKGSAGLGVDLNYYARGSFWVVGQQIAAAGISFVMTLVLARLLPADSFGVYRYVLSGIAIASAFSLTGLSTSVLQAAARNKDKVLGACFLLVTKSGFLSAAIAFSVAGYYLIKGNSLFAALFAIGGISLPLANSLPLFSSYWMGKGRFKLYSLSNIATDLVPAISLIAVATKTTRPEILLAAFLGTGLLANLFAYLHAFRESRKNLDSELDEKSIATGTHLSFLNIAFLAVAQLDRILVFQLLGPSALASYFFAAAFPEQVRSVLKGALGTVSPKLASRDQGSVMTTVFNRLLLIIGISILTSGLFIATAPLIYRVIIPQYSDMLFFAQLLTLSIPFTTASHLISLGLQSAHENKKIYSISILSGAAQLCSLLVIGFSTRTVGGFITSKIIGSMLTFLITIYYSGLMRKTA